MAKKSTTKSTDPFPGRLRRLKKLMDREGLDTLVVSDPMDVGYLCGFMDGDSYLVVGSGKATLVSDRRYEEQVEEARPLVKGRMRSGAMVPELADELASRKADVVGLQGGRMTAGELDAFKKALRKTRKAAKVSVTPGLVSELRAVKDAGEVRLITKAVRIQEAAMEATLDQIGPGMSELEIGAILEYEMKVLGSSDPSFATIVGSGANSSKGHYAPSARAKLKKNAPLLIDWGAMWRGYHGDMTRVFCFGRWPKKIETIYDVVLEAHEAAVSALGPGVACRDVDKAARDVIERAGFGDNFKHSLGHGIGLNVHEGPGLASRVTTELKPGHVVTVEPGVYFAGLGGVRIEDDYLITERGSRNLCRLPKDRAWATRRG